MVALNSASNNAPITVNVASACASLIMSGTYAGTLTFNDTLTLTSTCTFVAACTIAGTAGTLILNTGGYTITSGGKILTCALTFGTSATYTLGDNWSVNGLVTAGVTTSSTTLNSNQITCTGGFHQAGTTAAVSGTTKLVITGGTWDSASTGTLANPVDLAGNVTISGAISRTSSGSTITYVSGTITTTGSTLTIAATSTFNTVGMTWNSLVFNGSPNAISSTLSWSGTLTTTGTTTFTGAGAISGTGALTIGAGTITLNNTGGIVTTGTMTLPNGAVTFAGSAGFTVGTLTTATLSASRIHTLTFGNTYTVNTSITNIATPVSRQALISGTPGSKVVFNVTKGAAMSLAYCDPTDIDSSGGATVVSVGATITTSINWLGSVVAGSIGGPAPHHWHPFGSDM